MTSHTDPPRNSLTQHRTQTHEELLRFRLAMDMSGDAIYLVDRTAMRFVDVNQTACTRMGYSREELLKMGPQNLLAVSREEIERAYDEVIAAGVNGLTTESSARTKDGRASVTELHRRALRLDEGWIIVSIARDITRRKLTEEALRDSTDKLRLFADNVPVMAVSYDENLRCRFANKVYAEFFGFSVGNILGKHLREVVGEEVYQEIEDHFVQALRGHQVTYRRTRKLPDGGVRHFEVKVLPHIGESGQVLGCFTVTTDITEHKLAEERIQRVAHHDYLTGLPNRLLFNDRLKQVVSLAKRHSRQFALLYFDLDKFKPVNDTLGHAAGDQLLKSAAARVLHQVRESDTVARVGGDEFTVILPDIVRHQDIELVARKIIHALAAPFELGSPGQSIEIGTSIGIAVYPTDGQDADALVKAADTAMYNAKQSRNCYRFSGESGSEYHPGGAIPES